MATELGSEIAGGIANAHEEDSGSSFYDGEPGGNPCGEKSMDLGNNELGRNLASNPGTCEDKVLGSLDSLVIL